MAEDTLQDVSAFVEEVVVKFAQAGIAVSKADVASLTQAFEAAARAGLDPSTIIDSINPHAEKPEGRTPPLQLGSQTIPAQVTPAVPATTMSSVVGTVNSRVSTYKQSPEGLSNQILTDAGFDVSGGLAPPGQGGGGDLEISRLVQGLMDTFGMSEANAQAAALEDPVGSAEALSDAGAPGFGTSTGGGGAARAPANQQFQTDKDGNLVTLNPQTGALTPVEGGQGFGFGQIDPEREFAQAQGSLDEQARSNLATEMENIAVRAQRGELTTAQMHNEFNVATSRIANEFGINAAQLAENATQFRAQLQETGTINRAQLGVAQRGQDIAANTAEFQTRSQSAIALGNQSLDEAEQIRRTLSGPSDYLARAFQTRGGESPLDFVSQADQINELRANLDAFRAQMPDRINIPEQELIAEFQAAGGFVPPEFQSPGAFVAPDIGKAITGAQPPPVAAPATPAPSPAPAPAADAPTLPAWVTDRLNDPAFDANSPDGAAAAAAAGGFYTNGPVAQPNTPSLEMAGETPVQQEPGAGLTPKQPLSPEMGFAEGGFTTAKKFIVGDDPETGLNATSEVVENPEGAKLKIHKGAKARGLPMFATGTGGEFDFADRGQISRSQLAQQQGKDITGMNFISDLVDNPMFDSVKFGRKGQNPGLTNPVGTAGQNTQPLPSSSLFDNRGPVSQGQIAQQARDFSPPAVSDVLAGKSPAAMRLGFQLPSLAAYGKLTGDEKKSLGTRIGATHNASLGDLEFAQKQRFGRPGGAGQRARVGFGF